MSDELAVVTVTYSPGPHLDRFLASLSHATDRPVTVIMADNGSTDGAPEEALERYPNARLLRTGANLGYGTAVNRAVADIGPEVRVSSSSPTPMCSGAAQHRHAAGSGRAVAAGGFVGPLIRDPDGSVYPSARHLPSLIRGGMHAVIGPLWNPTRGRPPTARTG